MYVAVCKLALLIPESHSLKEKRSVVRRIKARIHQQFALQVAEVGSLDAWQKCELGLAVVASARNFAERTVSEVCAALRAHDDVQLVDVRSDLLVLSDDEWGSRLAFGDLEAGLAAAGAGDKAAGASAADGWVPEAWRDEADR
jgi:uncharacterized protein YlxP (DUF503 family)